MNTLLLIVDVQKHFVPEGAEGRNFCKLIEELQTNYKYVAISKFINTPDSSWVKYLDWDEMMKNDPSTELAFTPAQDALIYFSNTSTSYVKELCDFIENNSIKKVHVCGMDTEACVLATAFDLWDAKIEFQVLIDYCMSSAGENLHTSAHHIMSKNFGLDVVKPKEDYQKTTES